MKRNSSPLTATHALGLSWAGAHTLMDVIPGSPVALEWKSLSHVALRLYLRRVYRGDVVQRKGERDGKVGPLFQGTGTHSWGLGI